MNPLFVTGHGKTGTSTVVGILNSHPDIFLLYEVYAQRADPPAPRGKEFLASFPEARTCFGATGAWVQPYLELNVWLESRGHRYRYFGDKVLCHHLTGGRVENLAPFQVIYLVRDLRTWLCKNVVVADYDALGGVAAKAVTYVDDFLGSLLWPQKLHVSMEDLIHHNAEVIERLSEFLQIDLNESARKWWKTIGAYEANDPKNAIKWWHGHDSSRLRPVREDTTAVLADHPFWEAILPVFDKYFKRLNQPRPAEEVERDRRKLAEMSWPSLRLEELYRSVESVSFGSGLLGTFGHRSSNKNTKRFSLRKK